MNERTSTNEKESTNEGTNERTRTKTNDENERTDERTNETERERTRTNERTNERKRANERRRPNERTSERTKTRMKLCSCGHVGPWIRSVSCTQICLLFTCQSAMFQMRCYFYVLGDQDKSALRMHQNRKWFDSKYNEINIGERYIFVWITIAEFIGLA